MGRFGRKTQRTKKKGPVDRRAEAVDLVVGYLKQEILTPLRGIGRFVLYGLAGSILVCVGLLVLLLGVLRLLQGEAGSAFSGNQDWIPYVAVAVLALGMMALAGWRIVRGPATRRIPKPVSAPIELPPVPDNPPEASPVESPLADATAPEPPPETGD